MWYNRRFLVVSGRFEPPSQNTIGSQDSSLREKKLFEKFKKMAAKPLYQNLYLAIY